MNKILFYILVVAGLYACGSGTETNNLPQPDSSVVDTSATTGTMPASPLSDTGSLDGTWYLVAAMASDTATGKLPTIVFNTTAKNFTGHTGCNNMRGTFSSTDSSIAISEQIISTKMACPGYNENGFLQSLPKANHYRFENGILILMMDATEISRWSREPVKPTIKTA